MTPRVRIVSDGTFHGSNVYVDDKPLVGVTGVSWSLSSPAKYAEATIHLDNVAVDVVGYPDDAE